MTLLTFGFGRIFHGGTGNVVTHHWSHDSVDHLLTKPRTVCFLARGPLQNVKFQASLPKLLLQSRDDLSPQLPKQRAHGDLVSHQLPSELPTKFNEASLDRGRDISSTTTPYVPPLSRGDLCYERVPSPLCSFYISAL